MQTHEQEAKYHLKHVFASHIRFLIKETPRDHACAGIHTCCEDMTRVCGASRKSKSRQLASTFEFCKLEKYPKWFIGLGSQFPFFNSNVDHETVRLVLVWRDMAVRDHDAQEGTAATSPVSCGVTCPTTLVTYVSLQFGYLALKFVFQLQQMQRNDLFFEIHWNISKENEIWPILSDYI